MNKTVKDALDAAIAEDHPCSDSFGCDIEVARANGFTEAAAYLLTGATETPAVDRVIERYGLVIGDTRSPAFDRWYRFHRRYGRECASCESYMYDDPETGDRAYRCTNCMAPMGEKEEDA